MINFMLRGSVGDQIQGDGTHNELNFGPAHNDGPTIMGLYLELWIKQVGGFDFGG